MPLAPRPDTPDPVEKEAEKSCAAAAASPSDRFIIHDDGEEFQDLQQRIYLANPVWPLADPTRAMLFRHYVQQLAGWVSPASLLELLAPANGRVRKLDICDPQRSFEMVVSPRAGTCLVLLNAIIAFAARHMTNTNQGDFEDIAYASQKQCLEDVIAMLHHEKARTDENILAATIILRVVQEMEGTSLATGHRSSLPNQAHDATQSQTTA